jgi:ABC-type Na+ transport system ATPase subunit NatA
MRPVIVCDRLTKHFGAVRAVEELTFVVNAGEVVGFLGPNGAGKSAVHCLVGVRGMRSGPPACRAPIDALTVEIRVRRRRSLSARAGLDLCDALDVVEWDPEFATAHGLDDEHRHSSSRAIALIAMATPLLASRQDL